MISSIYTTSLYSSSTSTTTTSKGIAGLVTGINTDELIQQMTLGTRTKIATLYQKQTLAGWKQEAYQSITTLLLDFKSKFMNALSATNMRNASFYQSAVITPQGVNASKVSATGSMSADIANFSIVSVDKLATTAALTSTVKASQSDGGKSAIVSADISSYLDTDIGINTSRLEGEAINIKLNGVKYNINLQNVEVDTGDPLANADNVIAAINNGIDSAGLNGKIQAGLNSQGQVEIKLLTSNGNNIEIEGMGTNVKNLLGFSTGVVGSETSPLRGNVDITTTDFQTSSISNIGFNDAIAGKSITFNLNGVSKTINFDAAPGFTDAQGVADFLNAKLGEAFGTQGGEQKVSVTASADNRLIFTPVDETSILSVASASTGVIGYDGSKGALGINFGDANRLLTDRALTSANLNDDLAALFQSDEFKAGGNVDVSINGNTFSIYKDKIVMNGPAGTKTTAFNAGTSMRDIANTINNADVGVRMQYNSTTDRYSVTATDSGTMGKIDIQGDFADKLGISTTVGSPLTGQDAEIMVSFNGDTANPTKVTRSTNTFALNGLTITLNGTFAAVPGEEVTFAAKANTDAIVSSITDMITAYNDIITKVNNELNTKPNSAYQPLTDDQQKDMSQSQIDLWEAKAKEGLLFGDSILQSLATDIRFALSMPVGNSSLNQIGISVSSDWRDNGKLVIDESKLRQAIENDAGKVADIFTRAATGLATPTSQESGIIARLDAVMDKYTRTTGDIKGLLIERAGHPSSVLSLTNNALYRERAEYDKQVATLQDRLAAEEARYQQQFTSLETYVAQMNQQSAWLTQAFSSSSS